MRAWTAAQKVVNTCQDWVSGVRCSRQTDVRHWCTDSVTGLRLKHDCGVVLGASEVCWKNHKTTDHQ